jgi:hypothetical protein
MRNYTDKRLVMNLKAAKVKGFSRVKLVVPTSTKEPKAKMDIKG